MGATDAEVNESLAILIRALCVTSLSTGWKARDQVVFPTESAMLVGLMEAIEPEVQHGVQLVRLACAAAPPTGDAQP